jgi:hypothetical protein
MLVTCPKCGGAVEVTVSSLHPFFRYGVADYAPAIRLCQELKAGLATVQGISILNCQILGEAIRHAAIGGPP